MLSQIMKEKNITSQELANITGIPKRTIENYRAKRREPSLVNGLKIAEALKTDPKQLFRDYVS